LVLVVVVVVVMKMIKVVMIVMMEVLSELWLLMMIVYVCIAVGDDGRWETNCHPGQFLALLCTYRNNVGIGRITERSWVL
jgi:hypothetical protein